LQQTTLGFQYLLTLRAVLQKYSAAPFLTYDILYRVLRPRHICDIYDLFAPHVNVLTYLLTYTRVQLAPEFYFAVV